MDVDPSAQVQLPLSVGGDGSRKAIEMCDGDNVSTLFQMWSDLDKYREESEKMRLESIECLGDIKIAMFFFSKKLLDIMAVIFITAPKPTYTKVRVY